MIHQLCPNTYHRPSLQPVLPQVLPLTCGVISGSIFGNSGAAELSCRAELTSLCCQGCRASVVLWETSSGYGAAVFDFAFKS